MLSAAVHVIEPNRVPMDYDGYAELKVDLVGIRRLCRDGTAIHVASRQQRLIAALAVRGPYLRNCLNRRTTGTSDAGRCPNLAGNSGVTACLVRSTHPYSAPRRNEQWALPMMRADSR